MNIGLSELQLSQIITVLDEETVEKAKIFGSRAKGNWRYNSDIDIVVWGGEVNLAHLLGVLDELPMPYKFDVVDYHKITNTALREHIDRVGISIFER